MTQISCCESFRRKAEMRGPDAEHEVPESRQQVAAAEAHVSISQEAKFLLREECPRSGIRLIELRRRILAAVLDFEPTR